MVNYLLESLLSDYYYLRQRIPIFIYVFYLHFKESENTALNGAIRTLVSLIGLTTGYAFLGFILKIKFTDLIPFEWHYQGVLHWGIFFIAFYFIALHSKINVLTSFTLSTLATVGGGWLYEIPFYHPLNMFLSDSTIFLINGQILCLLLLAYELKKLNFKTGYFIYTTLFLFLVFSGILFLKMSLLEYALGKLFTWVYRIPASLFLASLISGIEKSE